MPDDPLPVDPLTEGLLPVLMHRLNNATQLLSGLRSLVALDPALAANRWDDLADAAVEADRLSWALAVLASASGSRLCLERREPEGLAIFVELVREALRREGKDLPDGGTLPTVAPNAPPESEGWELPWAIASVLYLVARNRERDAFDFSITETALFVRCPEEAARAFDPARVIERLPGAELARTGEGFRLTFPMGWLAGGGETR